MSIENPTLAHFRHFTSLFTNLPSTSVENPLQISSFYAKQTQLLKSQMNVNPYSTTAYENISNWTLGQSKPNSNPIKPNLRKAKMNVNSLITKDYRKYDDFVVRKNKPNSNPISEKPKMNVTLYVIEDYENKTALRPQKNKPKQSQFLPKSALLQLVKLLLCYSLINIAVQSCHIEHKKLFYGAFKALLGQEINSNVYNSQRQSNCFSIRPLSTARKCGQTRSVDFSQRGVLTHITAVFRKVETKLKGDTECSSDWLFFRGRR